MILGMSVEAFTLLHVIISLVGIVTGLIVVAGMLSGRNMPGWTASFLGTTLLTSVTGFLFPINGFTPAIAVGVLSLILLAGALMALYVLRLAGAWRPTYIAAATTALYLNCFVAVVQAFQKLAFLQPLAPTQTEAPFLAAQAVVLAVAIIAGLLAVKRFHPA